MKKKFQFQLTLLLTQFTRWVCVYTLYQKTVPKRTCSKTQHNNKVLPPTSVNSQPTSNTDTRINTSTIIRSHRSIYYDLVCFLLPCCHIHSGKGPTIELSEGRAREEIHCFSTLERISLTRKYLIRIHRLLENVI